MGPRRDTTVLFPAAASDQDSWHEVCMQNDQSDVPSREMPLCSLRRVTPTRGGSTRHYGEGPMFGDSMFEEEDRLRRSEEGKDDDFQASTEDEQDDLMAAGGLDERLRRRQAVAQLLREVGGC